MTGSRNRQKVRSRWYQAQRRLNLRNRAESVPHAVHEQCRGMQGWKVLRAQLRRLLRRMKGIGEQQKALNEPGLGRCQHRRLPAPIRVATEDDPAGAHPAHGGDGRPQSRLIALCAAAGWCSLWPRLTKWKITAEHHPVLGAETIRQRHEQGSLAICPGAVSEDQAIGTGCVRGIKISTNRRLLVR